MEVDLAEILSPKSHACILKSSCLKHFQQVFERGGSGKASLIIIIKMPLWTTEDWEEQCC